MPIRRKGGLCRGMDLPLQLGYLREHHFERDSAHLRSALQALSAYIEPHGGLCTRRAERALRLGIAPRPPYSFIAWPVEMQSRSSECIGNMQRPAVHPNHHTRPLEQPPKLAEIGCLPR